MTISRLALRYFAAVCLVQWSLGTSLLFAQARRSTDESIGLGLHAGRARVPVSRGLNGNGPAQGDFTLFGASLDYHGSNRVILEGLASFGVRPGGCGDACTSAGYIAEATMLYSPTSTRQTWGIAVGPTVGVAAFYGNLFGGGVRANIGTLRSAGPRLAVHFLRLTDGRHVAGVYAAVSFAEAAASVLSRIGLLT